MVRRSLLRGVLRAQPDLASRSWSSHLLLNMSEILIDVTRAVSRLIRPASATGVDRLTLAYIRRYGHNARAIFQFCGRNLVLSKDESADLFAQLMGEESVNHLQNAWSAARHGVDLLRHRHWRDATLFNLGYDGLEHPGYADRRQDEGVKQVFVVHGMTALTHPEYARARDRQVHAMRMNNVLQTGAGVIATTSIALMALDDYARKTARSMPPSVVALPAADDMPAPAPNRPILRPYFVVAGPVGARRNQLLLLQVWRMVVEHLGAATPQLVMLGGRGDHAQPAAALLEHCPAIKEFVTELPDCSDAEISTYIRHANALLNPGFVQNVGTSVLAALALGTPVISSDLPACREIAGDLPEFLDPTDGPGWLERILDYSKPHSLARVTQKDRIQRVAIPTWERHFQQVEAFLEKL